MRSEDDASLRDSVDRAWRQHGQRPVPPFAATWAAAERRGAAMRNRRRSLAAAAVAAGIVAVALNLRPPGSVTSYVETSELLESTSWSAPSDVLFPERDFDLYEELPVIIESTQPAGGTLL